MLQLSKITVAVLAVSLAGCALPGKEMTENRKRIAAEHEVQSQAMAARIQSQPLPLDTTLRIASTAVLMINVPAQGTDPATQAWLLAGCTLQTLGVSYRQAKGWTNPYILPSGPNQTAHAWAQQMCQAVRDSSWRQLPSDDEDLVIVDSGTLTIDGLRRSIWTGIDYGRTRLDEYEGEPYSRQFERVDINCATHQTSTRLAVRFTNKGLLPARVQTPVSALNAEQSARLVGAVCADPTHLTELAVLATRQKLPADMPTPEVPAALLTQVSTLPQGQSTGTLSHLKLTYDVTSALVPRALIKDSPMDLYLQPGPAPGIWRAQTAGALGSEGVRMLWRGLIELASTDSVKLDDQAAQRARLTQIDLVGDWKTLKPRSAIGYRKSFTDSAGKVFVHKFECSVDESFPAAQLVASLSGMARDVTCTSDNGLQSSNVYLYLEAYDLFVETVNSSVLITQIKTLKAAE